MFQHFLSKIFPKFINSSQLAVPDQPWRSTSSFMTECVPVAKWVWNGNLFLSSGILLFPSVATIFVWAMGLLSQLNIYRVTRQTMEKLDLDHIVFHTICLRLFRQLSSRKLIFCIGALEKNLGLAGKEDVHAERHSFLKNILI